MLELCENKKVYGFLSAASATDIFYLIRRQLHSVDLAYKALGSILDCVLDQISINPSDLAYILYISGSTGNPKGVMIEHRNIYNFVLGIKEIIDFRPGKIIACITTISFDIFFVESVLPILTGMTSVIFDEESQKDPDLFCHKMIENNVNILQIVPSRLHLIMKCKEINQCLCKINDIIIGGEMFPTGLIDKILSKTKRNIFNAYGPTEATVWCSVKKITGSEDVTIGKPMRNIHYYILDNDRKEILDDSVGELYISGKCIAKGYYQHPELTKKSFFKDLYKDDMIMYKSGDLARRLPNGEYQCLGRTDDQIKIRGYRIELGEIESIIMQNDCIEQTVVIPRKNPSGIINICCYYKKRKSITNTQLEKFISKRVPAYMVPNIFISVETFPYTPNGKINKKELENPFVNVDLVECVDIEEQVKVIWYNLVSLSYVDLEKNLFEIGGSSLIIINFCEKINDIFGLQWNVIKLYQFRNLKEIAENIKKCL